MLLIDPPKPTVRGFCHVTFALQFLPQELLCYVNYRILTGSRQKDGVWCTHRETRTLINQLSTLRTCWPPSGTVHILPLTSWSWLHDFLLTLTRRLTLLLFISSQSQLSEKFTLKCRPAGMGTTLCCAILCQITDVPLPCNHTDLCCNLYHYTLTQILPNPPHPYFLIYKIKKSTDHSIFVFLFAI